jgi:hypothetical protein
MSKTNKIIIGIILTAVLLLGVGYAAIQNISLNITGTATADVSQSNFVVKFSNTPQVSDSNKVTASVTNSTNATMNVTGLTTKGDSVTATYTVQNTSADLSANLSVQATNSNEEYFEITTELGKTTLTSGDATTLTVTITLIKTPITDNITSTIGLQLTSEPLQPGEEGGNGNEETEPDVTSITLKHNYKTTLIPVGEMFDVAAVTSPNANPTGTFDFIISNVGEGIDVGICAVEDNIAYICVDQATTEYSQSFTLKVTYTPEGGGDVVSEEETFWVEGITLRRRRIRRRGSLKSTYCNIYYTKYKSRFISISN